MQKLDIWHHKLIVILIALAIFIGGVFFGVRISGTAGQEGIQITIFSMLLVTIVLSYITFTQVIHLRDDVELKRRK